ncbi:uncharacterized protein BP5553_09059 [Venustampulla echinocandica]|uniref:Uncharacterized protein n=1 Tax=Venustampulla echinocandica TaxID=2656787 RepID=A0A370TDQ8_9HELO|nr:uncharacterized protein BP5553_09059 [Venustampulla echinocandica]RDL32603.1 hypothetical protein BP5553_09059 [Venustampulla echinocandica]
MAARKWDAYKSLNITGRDSCGMTCVGMNRFGKRCRWDISAASYDKIRVMFDAMEGRPPKEATKSLKELAVLSLCLDFHQNQANKVVDQWQSAVKEAAAGYENRMGLKTKIQVLEENLGKKEANSEELQKIVQELQARVRNQAGLRDRQAEIERLGVQLANEQANLTSVTNQWRTMCQKYEDQEIRTEEYRRAFLESDRKVGNLEEKNAETSRQLAGEKEVLNLATIQYKKDSATSIGVINRLVEESSTRTIEYQQKLSQKIEMIQRTVAERDDLRTEVESLELKLAQLNKLLIEKGQESDRSTTEQMNLARKVGDLTKELDSESKAASKYQSDFLQALTRHNKLLEEAADLRLQLDAERQKSSKLVLELEQAETTRTILSNDKTVAQSQLQRKYQKYEKLTAKVSQLTTDQATLSTKSQALQVELASEHEISAGLHQALGTTKEDLFIIKLALGEAQASLDNYGRDNEELKASAVSAAERETENFALIATLVDQIEFFRSHPFKAFSISIGDTCKRWSKATVGRIGGVGSNKRIIGASDPEVNCPA